LSETVFVALSGGVDSTYALFKLKSQGFNVVALTMDVGLPVSREWIEAAKHAAFSMGVMLNVVNLKDEFQKYVVDYFVKEYLSGRTPNPCAVCNRYIKFGLLREHALSMGADYYATGHYACLSDGRLMRAKDRNKDQSYFLCLVEREKFSSVLFPMCSVRKSEAILAVRDMVLNVPRESQEVCFLQGGDYRTLLMDKVGTKRGRFVDVNGNVIGEHDGFFLFTIGQRRGLGKTFGKPMYVVDIVPSENTVVLGDEKHLFKDRMKVSSINWFIDLKNIRFPLDVEVKIRSQHRPVKALLYEDGMVEFSEPQRAVTPGQVACFYRGDLVVAGAVIDYI